MMRAFYNLNDFSIFEQPILIEGFLFLISIVLVKCMKLKFLVFGVLIMQLISTSRLEVQILINLGIWGYPGSLIGIPVMIVV